MSSERIKIEEKIRADSAVVDGQFRHKPSQIFSGYFLELPVPLDHPRAKKMIDTPRFVVVI